MKYFTETACAVLLNGNKVCIMNLYAQRYCAVIMEDEKLCFKKKRIMIFERKCWPFTKRTFVITI